MAIFVHPGDRHVRRQGDDYWRALSDLLPYGIAWPRWPSSVLMKTARGLTKYWGDVDDRAADLLETESDPRITVELLPEWERAWGLPDECLTPPTTIAARQAALIKRMTHIGAQSREYFINLAAEIGYTITISEYSPWMVGYSEVGETSDGLGYWRWEIGEPEIRFYWTVKLGPTNVTWWQYGKAEIGVDPHCDIEFFEDIECLFRRLKPAHTYLIFNYSETKLSVRSTGTMSSTAHIV
jgi:uncharacterized protein YmfQ (DUF2313 family)